ncbi:MAG: UDP-N-acetylmuramoyl-L-alanyl-D-glutamate--2,6-diaminopimelate ligase [Lachnospiraceae bacterium]|nr:UDP-N-acetylmuramoyl-L-alanyl-D-glutamate--2,6-diaminopimelate ligase [Lachnospiraceae bacterium]
MKLTELLENLEYEVVLGDVNRNVNRLLYDSREVGEADVFVCITGAVRDAHEFVADVAIKGATAIIVEKDIDISNLRDVAVIKVADTRYALACMSAAYFGYPANKLITIGITGTKGKTTTTYMVKSILDKIGVKTGLIGTIETIIDEEHIPSCNTTPESYIVQKTFDKMVKAGCKCVVMEVSSQAMKLHRVAGFIFDYGVFTNISKDHIGPNEHKDFEEYLSCKAALFKQCKHGIFNADEKHIEDILKEVSCEVETFSIEKPSDFKAEDIKLFMKPACLGISYRLTGKVNIPVEIDIPGRFSVYNSLTAIAICNHFTNDYPLIESVLSDIRVKGRVEIIPVSPKYTLMIDYAHNAMSLESLLNCIREYNPKRIVTLFGCGGNRDKNRRFEMGEVSSRLSDLTVVTSDNPRFEEPESIIEDIITGVKKADGKYITIPDRKEAIKYVIENGEEGDIIILAGKGHEDYQEIKGVKYPMDERNIIADVKEMLNM